MPFNKITLTLVIIILISGCSDDWKTVAELEHKFSQHTVLFEEFIEIGCQINRRMANERFSYPTPFKNKWKSDPSLRDSEYFGAKITRLDYLLNTLELERIFIVKSKHCKIMLTSNSWSNFDYYSGLYYIYKALPYEDLPQGEESHYKPNIHDAMMKNARVDVEFVHPMSNDWYIYFYRKT